MYFNSADIIVSVYQLDLGVKWHFEMPGALERAILQGNISLEQLNNLVDMKGWQSQKVVSMCQKHEWIGVNIWAALKYEMIFCVAGGNTNMDRKVKCSFSRIIAFNFVFLPQPWYLSFSML